MVPIENDASGHRYNAATPELVHRECGTNHKRHIDGQRNGIILPIEVKAETQGGMMMNDE